MMLKRLTDKEIINQKCNVLPLVKTLLIKMNDKYHSIHSKDMFSISTKTFINVEGENIYYSYSGVELLKKIFKIHKLELNMITYFITKDKKFSYTFEVNKLQ